MRACVAAAMGLSRFFNNVTDKLLCDVVLGQGTKNCKEFAISTNSVIMNLDSGTGTLLQATNNSPLSANNGANALLRDPELVGGGLVEVGMLEVMWVMVVMVLLMMTLLMGRDLGRDQRYDGSHHGHGRWLRIWHGCHAHFAERCDQSHDGRIVMRRYRMACNRSGNGWV